MSFRQAPQMRKATPSDPGASTRYSARPRAQRPCQHHQASSIRPPKWRPTWSNHPKTQAAPAPANHQQKKGSQSYKRPPIPAIVCQHPLLHAIRYQLNFPESPGKTHEKPRQHLHAPPGTPPPISKAPASTAPNTRNPPRQVSPKPAPPNTKHRSTMQGVSSTGVWSSYLDVCALAPGFTRARFR